MTPTAEAAPSAAPTAPPTPAARAGGRRRRGVSLRMLAAVVRNPLDALPPAVFHEPVVRLRAAGSSASTSPTRR